MSFVKCRIGIVWPFDMKGNNPICKCFGEVDCAILKPLKYLI